MKFLYLLLPVFLMVSCTDVLEEESYSIATETFYKTTEEIKAAVYSSYHPIQSGQSVFGRNYLLVNLSQTDYGVGRGSYSSTSQFQGLDATNISRTNAMWQSFYLSIRNANIVIANAPKAIDFGVPEKDVEELIAEVKFIRAFCYFQLVINWGGVPLRTEETMTQIDLPRNTADEVYEQIVSDLKDAEGKLPETEEMAGRPSKWTAKTLLADVYLNMERWQDAHDKALEVINSDRYHLVNVEKPNDFYKIFGYDVVSGPEESFYMKYSGTGPNSFVVMLHHPESPYNGGFGSYAAYSDSVQNKLIRNWDYHDLRKTFNLYHWNIGFGPTTVLYKKFIQPDPTLGLSCDYPVYRYADLLLIYAEADCRANNGPTANGLEKLNMIHRRGYGKDPNQPSDLDFKLSDYNQETFIDLILEERMYELFSEHKRFYELKRTGRLKTIIKEVKGIDVAEKHLLWPIPNTEYNYNGAIDEVNDQNPGY